MPNGWQYNAHPQFSDDLLKARSTQALTLIESKAGLELASLTYDTRPIHGAYFVDLTPAAAPYFAGHYRGEPFPALATYTVKFGSHAGVPPALVGAYMDSLARKISQIFQSFELLWSIDQNFTPAQKAYRLAELSTSIFVTFLDFHPYADGNGHMSRMLIHLCFARYGFKRLKMPLHPRPVPPNGALDVLIEQHRQGNRQPLITYFLSTI